MARTYTGLKGVWEEVPRGEVFGARTVLSETTQNHHGARRFTVRCECGGIDRMTLTNLKTCGDSKTGGRCYRCAKRYMAEQAKKQKDDRHGDQETKRTAPGELG